MFKRILWVTDFSPHAQAAGKKALDCAICCEGGAIDVLTVINPEDIPQISEDLPNPFIDMEQEKDLSKHLEDEYKQHVLSQLITETAFLKKANVPFTLHLRVGIPWKEIVHAAEEFGSTLIVIGSHGKRSLADILLGSTAENVSKHAPCPVLLVR